MHVQYNLLQSQLIRLNRQGPDSRTNTNGNGRLDVLVAVGSLGSQDHQIPLAVLSRNSSLLQSRNAYYVVSRTVEVAYSLDAISDAFGRAPFCCTSQAADPSNKQSAAVHRQRLSLRGRLHSETSVSSQAAATAAVSAAMCQPAWQLQQQCLLPACKGLLLLPGKVTCCCLLVADAQLQQQQRKELQQLLQQAGAVLLNSSSSSSSLGEVVFEVLAATAAAAAAVSSTANDCSTYQQQLGLHQCGPVVCSSNLYNAVASALVTSSIVTNSNSNRPPCMFLAATTSGQVWVCDPCFALLGSSSSSSSNSSGFANGPGSDITRQLHQQLQQQTKQQSPLQCSHRKGLRLLLNLQQCIVSLLPISQPAGLPSSSCGSSAGVGETASAFLLVGSLGRVGLLHTQQGPKSTTVSDTTIGAAADPAAAAAAAAGDQDGRGGSFTQQLSMLHQQLPFAVQAAAVAGCPVHPQQQQQQQQGQRQRQQQQQPSGMALLLLSGSGSIYVADIAEAYAAVVGAATATAAMASSSSSKGLQLQPRKLELPGKIGNLWVLHQQQQQQQGIHSTAGGVPAGNAHEATNSSSSSSSSIVITQLQGSNQLLQLILDHNTITQQPQQQQQQLSGPAAKKSPSEKYNESVSSSNAAAAAAAVRSKLQGLMSALGILSTARESLEQGILQQDESMTSVGKDLSLLKSLGMSSTQPAEPALPGAQLGRFAVPTGGTAAKRTETAAQQQQQQQQEANFACDIQGLWPAPAAAGGTSCSSSMHMAVTVRLQAHSSSCSGIHQLGFGPGWQLLVSFTPESAQTPTWQTTVPLSLQYHSCPGPNPRDSFKPSGPCNWASNRSSDSSNRTGSNSSQTGYVCASLLLPLPDECLDLSEGGWLQIYAVKHAPSGLHSQPTSSTSSSSAAAAATRAAAAATAMSAAGGKGSVLGCLQEPGCTRADSSSALPAVALLGQQYVSVLQLSSMLAGNPGAAMLSASATAAAAATGPSGPSQPFSCILQLQAFQGRHAALVQQQQQQQQQQLQPSSHKRSRADLSDVISLQQGQQQQHASSIKNHRQQHKSPLGTMLGDWLESVAVAQSHGLGHHSSSSSSSNSSSSSSNLSVPGQGTQIALLRGQVGYNLGQGAHGQLTWASGPLILSQQQQRQATDAPLSTAATAARLDDGVSRNGEPRLPVQVAMQTSNVSGWAQMHRSFVMAVLQQLENASTGNMAQDDCSAVHRVDKRSSGRWCIAAQKQQLQKALHQLTQLHQQLMGLQDTAEKAVDTRAQVLAALEEAAGGNESCNSVQSLRHQERSKQLSSTQLLEQLTGLLSSWESGMCAGYGRAVLAASAASCLMCYED